MFLPCRRGTGSTKFESEVSTANISQSHSLDRDCHRSTLVLKIRSRAPLFLLFQIWVPWECSKNTRYACMHALNEMMGPPLLSRNRTRATRARKVGEEAKSHALRSCVPFARLTRSRTAPRETSNSSSSVSSPPLASFPRAFVLLRAKREPASV